MRKHVHSTTVTVDVDVDISTDDLDDDELREICLERGIFGVGIEDASEKVFRMWHLFRTKQDAQAIALAKEIAEEAVGQII